MRNRHWITTVLLAATLSVLTVGASALGLEGLLRKHWSDANTYKRHIDGFDSPDGQLALFEVGLEDIARQTVLASADGKTFYLLLPLPSPSLVENPAQKRTFSQVVTILWSPDSKHIATHTSLAKHSEVSVFEVKDGAVVDVTPKNIREVALKAAVLDEAKVKSSGQKPERWSSATVLRVQARFSTAGRVVTVPVEVVLEEGRTEVRAMIGTGTKP
ncbi:MAG: hypothetical protein WCP45_16805 [Verrucomicrobiota bacterium]